MCACVCVWSLRKYNDDELNNRGGLSILGEKNKIKHSLFDKEYIYILLHTVNCCVQRKPHTKIAEGVTDKTHV